MTEKVSGVCPICDRMSLLEVHHDRKSDLIRGQVCHPCHLKLKWVANYWDSLKRFFENPPKEWLYHRNCASLRTIRGEKTDERFRSDPLFKEAVVGLVRGKYRERRLSDEQN